MCQFDPYDSEAVAEALREAEDEGKRTSLIEATEKLASRISGEDVEEQTARFYRQIISGIAAGSG
jgi:DNA-binding SARP family transcriptional activator